MWLLISASLSASKNHLKRKFFVKFFFIFERLSPSYIPFVQPVDFLHLFTIFLTEKWLWLFANGMISYFRRSLTVIKWCSHLIRSSSLAGLGICMVIVSMFCCIYYNVIIMWTLYYLFNSFSKVVPWAECGDWSSDSCSPLGITLGKHSAHNSFIIPSALLSLLDVPWFRMIQLIVCGSCLRCCCYDDSCDISLPSLPPSLLLWTPPTVFLHNFNTLLSCIV